MSTNRSEMLRHLCKKLDRQPDLSTRLSKLRNVMSILKEDIDSLNHMIYLWKRQGFYCQSCSRKRTPGACGSTCPLLRPRPFTGGTTVLDKLHVWRGGLEPLLEQIRQYNAIAFDLKRCGNNISLYELSEWEALTGRWLKRGLNASYRMPEGPRPIMHTFEEVDWTDEKPRRPSVLGDDDYRQPYSPTDPDAPPPMEDALTGLTSLSPAEGHTTGSMTF